MTSFPTLSPQAIVLAHLRALNISIAQLAQLQIDTAYSKFMLERWLRGEKQLDERTEAPRLVRLVRDLMRIQKDFPAKLDFSDTENIRRLLESKRRFASGSEASGAVDTTERANDVH